ncbi:MAG: sugar ABC transporter ATP-binding protein, partial [Mycobacteriaceae bacterium]|nr:sugar ABC transporter ATP-binding protein [Mycobacteriaceae bacterium]
MARLTVSTRATQLSEVPRGAGTHPLLALTGITKTFPGVRALHDVSLTAVPGRGLALVGENGAGKSTLIKIMAGLVRPDTGRIVLDGEDVTFRSPAEAHRRGIALVPQELSLVPWQSVAENIFMGNLPRTGLAVQRGQLKKASRDLLDRLGVAVDPGAR